MCCGGGGEEDFLLLVRIMVVISCILLLLPPFFFLHSTLLPSLFIFLTSSVSLFSLVPRRRWREREKKGRTFRKMDCREKVHLPEKRTCLPSFTPFYSKTLLLLLLRPILSCRCHTVEDPLRTPSGSPQDSIRISLRIPSGSP